MALFSRHPKHPEVPEPEADASDAAEPSDGTESPVVSDAADGTESPDAADATEVPDATEPSDASDVAPRVGISTSSFGGFGAAAGGEAGPASAAGASASADAPASAGAPGAPPLPPGAALWGGTTGEAPAPTETMPGLPDNVLLREALAALGDDPEPARLLNAARQLLQGVVYFRVKGDARALLSAGEDVSFAVVQREEGPFALLFSGGAALADAVRADGDVQTAARGQPVQAVLQTLLDGPYAGVVVDQASAPAAAVFPRALIERAAADLLPGLAVKTLLCAPRTPQTAAEVVQALTTVPLWLAANRTDDGASFGIAEVRTAEGERVLEVFTHPLEVVALGRGDGPVPLSAGQLATALATDPGLAGIVVDPAGPWIRIDRPDLGALLALAEKP